MPEPVFEWYVDKVGKYRFRLKAANGEMIAVSEGYASKQACLDGIESVKKNASIAKIVEAKEKDYRVNCYSPFFIILART